MLLNYKLKIFRYLKENWLWKIFGLDPFLDQSVSGSFSEEQSSFISELIDRSLEKRTRFFGFASAVGYLEIGWDVYTLSKSDWCLVRNWLDRLHTRFKNRSTFTSALFWLWWFSIFCLCSCVTGRWVGVMLYSWRWRLSSFKFSLIYSKLCLEVVWRLGSFLGRIDL